MAATLVTVRLQGFKSFANAEVELGPLNLLIGANGAGKSNFLGFFRLLQATTQRQLQGLVQKLGGAAALLHRGPKHTSSIEWAITLEEGGVRTRYEATLGHALPDRLMFTSEEVSSGASDNSSLYDGGTGGALASLLAGTPERLSPITASAFAQLRRLRVYHFHDTSDTAPVKQTVDLQDNRALRSDAGNLAAFLYMLKQAHPAHYREVVETVRLAFPLFDDFVLEPSRLNPNKLLLTWKERGSDYELGPHQLSDGTLRFICLTALLLQPFEHPDAPHIVTIDEPELGLHPYALNLLASMLQQASEKAQLIVSTQSASLLSAVGDPAAVVIVDRKDGASTLRRVTEEELAPWLDDYSLGDIWEKGVIGGRP